MRKRTFLFMLATLLLAVTGARAQSTLTVFDGTQTNQYFPVYGYYVDTQGTTSEFIIPADTEGMSAMEGGTITKVTFYRYTSAESWGEPTIQLYIGEVDYTTLSGVHDPADFTVVKTMVWSNQQNTIEVEFDEPYTYNGGNLLIGTRIQTLSSTYKQTFFTGADAPNGSSYCNNADPSSQTFLPKTTFTYEPASTDSPKPIEQVTIGSGSDDLSNVVPSYTDWNYSYTQQIYTAAEIGISGSIKSISFKGNKNVTRALVVYMANTSKEAFASTSDFIPIAEATQVFSGNVTFAANEWTTIELDGEGFDYDGDNLAVIIDDNSGNYDMRTTNWAAFNTTNDEALYFYQDSGDIDPASPNASNTNITQTKNQIILGIIPTTTPKPSNVEVSNLTPYGATISWEAPADNVVKYYYQYGPTGGAISEWLYTNETSVSLSELTSATSYTFYVYAEYADGISNPASKAFTTEVPCPAPTNLTATNVLPTSATLNWEGEADSYNVRYGVSGGEVVIFEDGFENGMGNWTIISNGEYTETTWSQCNVDNYYTNFSNHNGNYVARSRSYVEGSDVSVDNWLITPQVALDGDLKYWVINDDGGKFSDQYAIYVSTTGNAISDFTLLYTPGNNTTWTEHVVDLRSFNGTLGYIAIRHNDSSKHYLLIDDFGIYATQKPDEWTNATSTTNSLDITDLTPEMYYVFQVQANCGSEDGMSQWSTASFTTPDVCAAPIGLTAEVKVKAAELSWTGAQENYNVQYGKVVIFEDFDNGIPSNWTTIDADNDGNNWTYSFKDDGVVSSASYINDYGEVEPDNWLISPLVDLRGTLSVWLQGQDPDDYAEHFAIYLSTNGNSVDDFTTTLIDETLTSHDKVKYTADLSGYAGQQGYIAIRHFNCSDQYWLNVDDFAIIADMQTTTANGNTATINNLEANSDYMWQVQGIDCDGNGGTTDWSAIANFTTPEAPTDITLSETENNASWITYNDGVELNVTLGRTLRTGGWNTFSVPFDITIEKLVPLGFTVLKQLESSMLEDNTITLNFTDASAIEAGKPYLVKVSKDVVNPTFESVVIADGTHETSTHHADFMPVINPTALTGGDESVLFVTGGNTLTYPAADGNINGFRAYFQLHNLPANARTFRMNFGNEDTGITTIDSEAKRTEGIYMLDGRRINGMPRKKGVYIENGHKKVKR